MLKPGRGGAKQADSTSLTDTMQLGTQVLLRVPTESLLHSD